MAKKGMFEGRYRAAIPQLLEDNSICVENRTVFQQFFKELEVDLKRKNGLRALDEPSYRTLYYYITKLRTVNSWFQNKPWTSLTKNDIERVYNALEDGKIKRSNGKPYETGTYYSHIILSRPFEIAGTKSHAKEVIRFTNKKKRPVRFIEEQAFKDIASYATLDDYRVLLWLAFDYGENINSLLRLERSNFIRQVNEQTKEPEYRLRLTQDILKRSRQERSEINNYPETARLLDKYLESLQGDRLFAMGYESAKKYLHRIALKAGVKCQPNGETPSWKDLRSSMACDLLKKGWTRDEVNARLGHTPSSSEIDTYINFLAIERHKPKQKVHQYEMGKLQEELLRQKELNKLQTMRTESLQRQIEQQQQDMARVIDLLQRVDKQARLKNR